MGRKKCMLIVNAGSSSIKYALYKIEQPLNHLLSGQIKAIGSGNAQFTLTQLKNSTTRPISVDAENMSSAFIWLLKWLKEQGKSVEITAIGHRVVQGMEHSEPQLITKTLFEQLKAISNFDPEHLPAELSLIAALKTQYPDANHVACFDTFFHSSMPEVAKIIPIPKKYRDKGIKRYGFHGISFAFIMDKFKRLKGAKKAKGKIIIAHLGSGASVVAIKNGKSVDTSMGFTPASGLTMSTRTGDLDPGVAWHLQKFENLTPTQFNHLVNHESGLLAISQSTGDMEKLLKAQHEDMLAAVAIDFFCYQCIKWIGAFTAVLGGLETLIFTGGIGENSPEIRKRICNGLQFLGVEIDAKENRKNQSTISKKTSEISVRVIQTNEELMIAKLVVKTLNHKIKH